MRPYTARRAPTDHLFWELLFKWKYRGNVFNELYGKTSHTVQMYNNEYFPTKPQPAATSLQQIFTRIHIKTVLARPVFKES